MADDAPKLINRLLPRDEYTHTPDAAANYNESMYFNVFDHRTQVGGWFRIGNRPNEGYAEMSVCLYLPGGRVAFMFGRPKIANNDAMNAGGVLGMASLHVLHDECCAPRRLGRRLFLLDVRRFVGRASLWSQQRANDHRRSSHQDRARGPLSLVRQGGPGDRAGTAGGIHVEAADPRLGAHA